MERLGLGYDDLKEDFPKLIYASISGTHHPLCLPFSPKLTV